MSFRTLISSMICAAAFSGIVACGAAPDPSSEGTEAKPAAEGAAPGANDDTKVDSFITTCPKGERMCTSGGVRSCQPADQDCPVCFRVNGRLECL